MDPRLALISDISKVLQKYGFTNATEHRLVIRNDQLSLAVTSRSQEAAEQNIKNNLFLLTDRPFNWHDSFLFNHRQIWLIDFDGRHKSPWICTDCNANIYFLSTNEMRKYAIADELPNTGRLPDNAPGKILQLAEQYATWG